MSDSFPYNLRVSPRARYVWLRMTVQRGLEIVVPRTYDLRKIPDLLESKRSWIEATRLRFSKLPPRPPLEMRPTQVVLTAVAETWTVEYVEAKRRSVFIKEQDGNRLVLSGAIHSELGCRRALRRWLLQKAREHLVAMLERVSFEISLPFSTAAVRLQRSRWGSCSRKKSISLNAKLLFVAPELVRYLLIHELCHTVEMNHSERFWALVEAKEPNYAVLDKQMGKAMRHIPAWV